MKMRQAMLVWGPLDGMQFLNSRHGTELKVPMHERLLVRMNAHQLRDLAARLRRLKDVDRIESFVYRRGAFYSEDGQELYVFSGIEYARHRRAHAGAT